MGVMAHRRVAVFGFVAALVAFCIVQDRGTAAGARQYVDMYRAAASGARPAVTIDEIMRPAVRGSVRDGLVWAGGITAAGLSGAALLARRARRG
jgi:hypothetical protein